MAGDAEGARRTLARFVDRAAAIMGTAAAGREDLATLGSTIKVLLRVGERQQQIQRAHLPQPELVEAAAFLRPVTLKKEPVHLDKVLGAVRLLLLPAPQPVRDRVREIHRAVNRLLAAERWVVMATGPSDGQVTRLTDVQIAELWFNANVWHNDVDKQWALRHVPPSECLVAATVWVSDRVLVVRAVQQLLADLGTAGYLHL